VFDKIFVRVRRLERRIVLAQASPPRFPRMAEPSVLGKLEVTQAWNGTGNGNQGPSSTPKACSLVGVEGRAASSTPQAARWFFYHPRRRRVALREIRARCRAAN
jgi:hypothetical protein